MLDLETLTVEELAGRLKAVEDREEAGGNREWKQRKIASLGAHASSVECSAIIKGFAQESLDAGTGSEAKKENAQTSGNRKEIAKNQCRNGKKFGH